jgi:hypothetical protein
VHKTISYTQTSDIQILIKMNNRTKDFRVQNSYILPLEYIIASVLKSAKWYSNNNNLPTEKKTVVLPVF